MLLQPLAEDLLSIAPSFPGAFFARSPCRTGEVLARLFWSLFNLWARDSSSLLFDEVYLVYFSCPKA